MDSHLTSSDTATPDYAFRLTVTKKELSGTDGVVLSGMSAGAEPGSLSAQFSGLIPRALGRGFDLEDPFELYLVIHPATRVAAAPAVPDAN